MGKGERVLVALSGGVDSSVCVQLLKEKGYAAEALVILFSDEHEGAVAAARRAADQLGVPLTVWDCRALFRSRVIAPFCAAYCAGRTPNPCVICNPEVKFRALCEAADERGIKWVASGHYARLERQGGVTFVRRAASAARDQSYMLYRLGQPVLSRLLLPLGGYEKPRIRQLAQEMGLACADAPDSQEICFIPDGDHGAYIRAQGYAGLQGRLIGPQGQDLGPHKGVEYYTIGQRRGLGVALGQPVFVQQIEPGGDIRLAYASGGLVSAVWLDSLAETGAGLCPGQRYEVKIRSAARPAPCRVEAKQAGRALVAFDTPLRAAAPGQSAVLYKGELVAGGGLICAVQQQGAAPAAP